MQDVVFFRRGMNQEYSNRFGWPMPGTLSGREASISAQTLLYMQLHRKEPENVFPSLRHLHANA